MCLHCHLWFYTRRTVIQHANHFHARSSIPLELDESDVVPYDEWQMDQELIEPPVISPTKDPTQISIPDSEHYDDPFPGLSFPSLSSSSVTAASASSFTLMQMPSSSEPTDSPSQPATEGPAVKAISKRAASNLEKKYPCNHCPKRYKTHNGRLFHEQKVHSVQQQVISATSGQPLRAIVKGADGQVVASGVIQFLPDSSGGSGVATLVPTTDSDPLEVRASESNETSELAGRPKAPRKPRATNPKARRVIGRKSEIHIIHSDSYNAAVKKLDAESGPVVEVGPDSEAAVTETDSQIEVPVAEVIVKSKSKPGPKLAPKLAPKAKRKCTINGWVDGKVHHKEQGINNKKLHERVNDEIPESGVVRKLYCKNSRWLRLQEEKEREQRLRLSDPKLEMDCFVSLTDILKCYVHMEETERNGMTIFN